MRARTHTHARAHTHNRYTHIHTNRVCWREEELVRLCSQVEQGKEDEEDSAKAMYELETGRDRERRVGERGGWERREGEGREGGERERKE
jgi:hypothetical protein